jgi:lipid-A-disaccharide synthase
MARVIDHVLALLPFEPPLMQAAGMDCDFVGHPVVAVPVATPEQAARFRADHGIGNAPLILALPGSRAGEVSRLAPVFGRALALALGTRPGARVVLPAAEPVADMVEALTADWPGQPILLAPATDGPTKAAKLAAFAAADVALAASGTVSLELAAARTPMIIAYDMNWISRQIISRMLKVDTVTLVNLVSETRVVPEFIGKNCRPEPIAAALGALMDAPDGQLEAMALTMERLGQGGEAPGLRAAKAILARL